MIPLPAALSRSMISFSSCFGVILLQSLAHRSAPNTTIPRERRSSSVAGVDSKPGKRKNGQCCEHTRRGGRPWPVIEGEHHFVVGKRQALRKAFQTHPRRGPGIDGKNPRRAERIRMWTWHGGRRCG